MGRCPQIHLGLATAGDALQQKCLLLAGINACRNLFHCLLLLRRQLQAFAHRHRPSIAIAQHPLFLLLYQPRLAQRLEHCSAHTLSGQLGGTEPLCDVGQHSQGPMLSLRSFEQGTTFQHGAPRLVYRKGLHGLFLQALAIAIIQKLTRAISHCLPANAGLARYEQPHSLRQATHIIICQPASRGQHFAIKPGTISQGSFHIFNFRQQARLTGQCTALHHKALHLLAAKGHYHAPAPIQKGHILRHSIGKLAKEAFHR